ncbi:MAG: OmpA family protein, partial [Myxococcales bacterium]|nr:OmpA family protein [Myxococcales bacterium]
DNDGDGITDADDACPGAAGDPSDDPQKNGCPADPDRDGIRYGDDACPLEAGPRSAIASENGCPPKPKPRPGTTPQPGGPPTVAIEGDEHFEYMLHGAELVHIVTPDKEKRLNALAAELRSDSVKRAILQGHTDDSGDEGYNQMLSERRAEKLKQWLVIFGRVPADKLVVRGFGATRPVGDNRVRTGREQNRRVEVVIER